MPKLLFFVSEDWYFCSHRLPLARAAVKSGYEVVLLTRVRGCREEIESAGIRIVPLAMRRRSLNPYRELKTLIRICAVFRKEKPDLVHLVALKPVLYGSTMARLARVQCVVSAITGLGYVFSSRKLKALLLRPVLMVLLRVLLNRPRSKVILQNPDDQNLLVGVGAVARERTVLIRGAGVDLRIFSPRPEEPGPLLVLLASRMLWDKGIGEFVAAAKILHQRHSSVNFVLVGDPDPENPSSVPEEQLIAWREKGLVDWWGRQSDMPDVFRRAHIVCLPTSYGEGVPKVLLEAAACGRPIIATDSPGCREIVRSGDNGLLVPVNDSAALSSAIELLIENPALRRQMGARGRDIVVQEFSVEKVVSETVAVYKELLRS